MKILVADDDPILRRLMRELLVRDLGYEVIEATDGLKCWQALDSGLTPDLCIFDVLMPEMGGLDLLAKLRADPRFRRQKVILCSTSNDRATVVRAGSQEVAGYLVKPFNGRSFVELVRKVCEAGRVPSLPPALEPVETALKRLGIGNDLYLELVNAFTIEVKAILTRFADWPAQASQQDLELRLVSARGAGLSLGAGPVVAAIRTIERELASGPSKLITTSLETLKAENDRVIVAVGGIVETAASPAVRKPKQEPTPRTPPAEPSDCPLPSELNSKACARA